MANNELSLKNKLTGILMYLIIMPVILLIVISGLVVYPHMYGILSVDTSHYKPLAMQIIFSGIPFTFYFFSQIIYQKFILGKNDINFGYALLFWALTSLGLQVLFISKYLFSNY